MKTDNVIVEKSKCFAVRVVKLCQYLVKQKGERVLSTQLLRSGTSIGANVKESIRAHSRNDFIAKLVIALKEGAETEYWLELLDATGYLTKKQFESVYADCQELLKLLTAIIKTARSKKKL
jgi:four helix bundle protein